MKQGLTVRPIRQAPAAEFVRLVHRHNKRTLPGWKFGSGLYLDGQLVGVGIAGTCSSRELERRGDGHFIEIRRVATDGTLNACSAIYARMIRAAKAIGYCRVYTYSLQSESGASLKASGFVVDAGVKKAAKGWDRPSRPRDDSEWPDEAKVRWVAYLGDCDMHGRDAL